MDVGRKRIAIESKATMASSDLEPRDDMEFDSHEAAYEFYREYAKSVGFGTAKLSSRRSRTSKEFIDAKFSCIRYGSKQQSDDAINPRPSPKIGCKASLHVKRKPDGKWYVYNFVKEHNHELLPAQAHFFRSHRDADPVKNDVRVRRRKILAAVSKQFSAYQNFKFLDNLIISQQDRGRRLSLEAGDARVLLNYFMQMQEGDPKFFYAVDLNEEHRLRNVFWVDSKGLTDYSYFSDVVSIDTMYFSKNYKIPLVLFVGVNHHIQPTLLGCALVADETVHTFLWLIQTWLAAMDGKPPRIVLTEENKALKAAVSECLPDSRHCFHLWDIVEKIPKRLEYLIVWLDNFMEEFNECIHRSWTEEEFEKKWWKLLEKFKVRDDEWIRSLYEDRVHWVPVFMRGTSFAGLFAASRVESLNSSFSKYVNAETSLREFLEQYTLLLEDRYEEEAKAEFDSWHEAPELRSPSPFEKQMFWVYTHEIFKKFQVEVLGAAACHLKKEKDNETGVTYAIKDFENNQDFTVEWNESNSEICCSCRLFEYQGYLCRHAIVVLQMSGVFSISSKYILQRWTNVALSRHAISEKLDEVQAKVRRYNDLCRRAIILGEEGSLSQESYSVAVSAIGDALRRCNSLNSSLERDLRPESCLAYSTITNEEYNPDTHIASYDWELDMMRDNEANLTPSRTGVGREDASHENNVGTRESVPLAYEVSAVRSEDGFTQMETASTRPAHLHNMFPVHFHNAAPNTMFQGTPPAQLHHTTRQRKHLQH